MDHLFSKYAIKNVELENRIVMPSLASFLIDEGGSITERTIEHYRRRAAGGPGMVIMEACAVSPEGVVSSHQARIDDDRFVEGLAKIARVMKSEGAVPAMQLHHAGRQTSARLIGRLPLAPSPLPCPTIRGDVEPLTREGIAELVRKFSDGARRAREAGFELIEVHGAHGYLVNQFLSPFSNIRTDEYGGSVAGRTRFAREIVEALRTRLGEAFPISFKISAQEFVPAGLTVEQSVEILRVLVGAGVDVVQVSAGNDATPEWIAQPMLMEKACLADSAGQIRGALDVPVMAVGRINDPVVAEELLREGKADLICVGRGLLADPEMPRKAKGGNHDDIRRCIACNTCMESIFKRGRVECLVNPALGREEEMELRPAVDPRKVVVVGGGPAGLNVAWVAAKRGHRVVLFERGPELGGQLLLGTVTGYKREMRSLIEFLRRQVAKSGVDCRLGCDVTAERVRAEDPDVVVLANGASPVLPAVEGIRKAHVVTFNAVLNGTQPAPVTAVVVGGGATGSEIALHLAEQGCAVTIVEVLPHMAATLESLTRKVLLRRLEDLGVAMRTEHRLSRVVDGGAVIVDKEGNEALLRAEKVVVAIGARSDNALCEELESLGIATHRIGDCLEPRTAKTAIYEGAVLGRSI